MKIIIKNLSLFWVCLGRKAFSVMLIFIIMCITVFKISGAKLEFAPIFNNGAVLQCNMPVKLWGNNNSMQTIEIQIDNHSVAWTKTDTAGKWDVLIPAQEPGGPHEIKLNSNQSSIKISNVWFGEVWLASGQAKMVQKLINAKGGKARLKLTMPDIRFVVVPKRTGIPVNEQYSSEDLKWKTFKPGPNNEIASLAFFFAEYLHKHIGRKIGIIQSSVGGTPIESWMSANALSSNSETAYLADYIKKGIESGKSKDEWMEEVERFWQWRKDLLEWRESGIGKRPVRPSVGRDNVYYMKNPTVLYKNMILPLIPYTTKGVIWCQGESNADDPDEYKILFPNLIRSWREVWNRSDWPFYYTQLAAYDHPNYDWAKLRAAQAYTRDLVPFTGMAVAIDIGEKDNIHPKYKQPLGERLARLALDNTYGRNIVSRGPLATSWSTKNGLVYLDFQYVEKELQSSEGEMTVPGFEIAGEDSIFHSANARIVDKDVIELQSNKVKQPKFICYAWDNWLEPEVTLENSAGLPAEPFILGKEFKRK